MKKVNVPKTDLHASTLALGTDYFGSTVDRELSMQLMDRYLEAGGNVIDTAELYASWVPGGEHQSEKVIGEWLRDRGVRDRVILSTKGAHPKLDAMDVARMSKADIQADLEGSLRRLGVERVDLYWLHRDAPGYPVEDILQSLEAFRQDPLHRLFQLDATARGASPPSGAAPGRSRLCCESKHVEPRQARRLASRSDLGLYRRVVRALAP
jgi:aryl-alcohol dehydrogenase-like predicted oxidoreductase